MVRLRPSFKHPYRGAADVLYPTVVTDGIPCERNEHGSCSSSSQTIKEEEKTLAKQVAEDVITDTLLLAAIQAEALSKLLQTSGGDISWRAMTPADIDTHFISSSAAAAASSTTRQELSPLSAHCPALLFPDVFVRLLCPEPLYTIRPLHAAPGSFMLPDEEEEDVPSSLCIISQEDQRRCLLKCVRLGKWQEWETVCEAMQTQCPLPLLEILHTTAQQIQKQIGAKDTEQCKDTCPKRDKTMQHHCKDMILACRLLLSDSLWVSQTGRRIRRFTGNPETDEGLCHFSIQWLSQAITSRGGAEALDTLLHAAPAAVAASFPPLFNGTEQQQKQKQQENKNRSDDEKTLVLYRRLLAHHKNSFGLCSGTFPSPLTGRPMLWLQPKGSLFGGSRPTGTGTGGHLQRKV